MMQRQHQESGNEATANKAENEESLSNEPGEPPSFEQSGQSQPETLPVRSGMLGEIVGWIEAAGILVWLHGGWGIDALTGQQTGTHNTIDLAVLKTQAAQVASILRHHGFLINHELPYKCIAQRGVLLISVIYFEYDAAGSAFTDLGKEQNFHWPTGSFPAIPNGRLGNLALRVVSAEAQRQAQLFDMSKEGRRSSDLHKLLVSGDVIGALVPTELELRQKIEHQRIILCLERIVFLPTDFRVVFSAWRLARQSQGVTNLLPFPTVTGPLQPRRERRRNGLGITTSSRLQVRDNLGTIYSSAEFRENCAGAGFPTWFTWISTFPCVGEASTLSISLEQLTLLSGLETPGKGASSPHGPIYCCRAESAPALEAPGSGAASPREVYGPWSFTIPLAGALSAVS